MKSHKQILLLAVFISIGLLAFGMNMNRACGLVNSQIVYMEDDPNEPDPEIAFMTDDPNDPEPDPEIVFLGDDPNDPEPDPEIVFMGDDPNEPDPEYK
jgi:hypothetical protein